VKNRYFLLGGKEMGEILKAGAAQVDITPKAGTHLAGAGTGIHRPAQSILDPLYAKAVVFEVNGRKVCFLALDVLCITREYTTFIRKAAAERFGFEPDAVMVHSLQIHSAPSCGGLMLDPDFPLQLPPEYEYLTGAETEYSEYAAKRAVEAIEMANKSLRPVKIGVGSGICGDIAFNRRAVMWDGKVAMPGLYSNREKPLGPTEIRYMEGPIDPEVGVFCARDDDMKMVAMLLHYTCHPVNVFATEQNVVSSDWPGAWSKKMQEVYGKGCVPLVLNGCCGNINPWPPFTPDFVPDHRRMGEKLADMSRKVIGKMKFEDSTILGWKIHHIELPYRKIPKRRQREVEKILSEYPRPKWSENDPGRIDLNWFRAASTKSIDYCRRRWPKFPYEVQVLRVGDTVFVGLPGEPFVEGQLAIKIGSPANFTYIAHMTSHYVGYIPTKEAYRRGGHEANEYCTYWAKLAPEALDMIVDAAVDLLNEMFEDKRG